MTSKCLLGQISSGYFRFVQVRTVYDRKVQVISG